MKIGIDLDGVLFDLELLFSTCAEIYDVTVLKRNSLKDKTQARLQEGYNWSDEEKADFLKQYVASPSYNIIAGAKEAINCLSKLKHQFYIITAKGRYYQEEIDVAKQKIKESGLVFDKYF